MFGGGQDQSSDDQGSSDAQRLDLHGSAFGAYDANLFRGPGTSETDPIERRFRFGGSSWGATAGLQYSKPNRRVSFGATADTALSVYPALNGLVVAGHNGGVNVAAPLGRRTSFHASQNLGYMPLYSPLNQFGSVLNPDSLGIGQVGAETPGAGQPGIGGVSYGGYHLNSLISDTSTALTHSISDRSSVSFMYGLQYVSSSDPTLALKAQTGGGRFQRSLTKGLSLRLGYSFWQGKYGRSDQSHLTRWHNVDVGLDYQKALSISRRTKVGFGLGSAIFVNQHDNTYTMLGNANLVHEIGRTWRTGVAYDRSVQFIRGFHDPFLLDGVDAYLDGLINRRLEFRAAGRYSTGKVGFAQSQNGVVSYLGSARLSYALTRQLAIYGEYFYYHYSFGQGVQLPLGFGPVLDRHGVHGGLSLWLPLLDRRTAPNRRP